MAVPTTRKIVLSTSSSGATNLRGDAGKLLSRHNHRLYRQGRLYKIRIGAFKDFVGTAKVFALRPDWMVMKSWKLGFEAFMNNSKEELEALSRSGGKARWQDFRVADGWNQSPLADWDGVQYNNVGAVQRIVTGEFLNSRTRSEAGTEFTFSWGSGGATVFSLLEQFSRMGNANLNPSTPTTLAAYSAIDDDKQDGQTAHLSDAGNAPPYSSTNPEVDSPWVMVGKLGTSPSGAQSLSTGYFEAPCGLFVVVSDSAPGAESDNFFLEAHSGDYKGVAAESMGEAKLVKDHYRVK